MDLTISKKHSHYARRGQNKSCPAARAFKSAGFKTVDVAYGSATLDGEYYELPATLENAIRSFDDGEQFRHGTYRIAGVKRPKARAK